MAILKANSANKGKEFVIVERGDTLSRIAQNYSKYTGGVSYNTIASWNNIKNADLIYVNQKIYLTKEGADEALGKIATNSSPQKVTLNAPNLKADSSNVLVATWYFLMPNSVEKYKVEWRYHTKSWSPWTSSEVTDLYHTYTIPDVIGVTKVEVRVTPIIKEGQSLKVNSVTENYNGGALPAVPSGLKVTLDGTKLRAEISKYTDPIASMIVFQYSVNGIAKTTTKDDKVELVDNAAAREWTIALGNTYKVRCWARGGNADSYESDWSEEFTTIPATPKEFTEITPTMIEDPNNSNEKLYAFKLVWTEIPNADEYLIEYTTGNSEYFNTNPDAVSRKTIKKEHGTTQYITDKIVAGKEFYFRIKAINEKGKSDWSAVKSASILEKPSAPTIWSSSTVVGSTDRLIFYWVHNSEDNSLETAAEITVQVNEDAAVTHHVAKNQLDAEKGIISSYEFKMVNDNGTPCYPLGGELRWCVRTSGASNILGDFSEKRTVQIYSQPELALVLKDHNHNILASDECYLADLVVDDHYITDTEKVVIVSGALLDPPAYTTDGIPVRKGISDKGEEVLYWIDKNRLTSYPIKLTATTAETENQTPISYHVSVVSDSEYETVDNVGRTQTIHRGVEIYSRHFDGYGVNPLEVTLSAGDINLEDGATYTVKCTVAMSSGLTAQDTASFSVSWENDGTMPMADVEFDPNSYSATIYPYCGYFVTEYRRVNRVGKKYVLTDQVIDGATGSRVKDAEVDVTDSDGNLRYKANVWYGVISGKDIPEGTTGHYCELQDIEKVSGVLLSVYRREYDGTFTELASNLPGLSGYSVTDPHPSLDSARYRIVTKSNSTGSVMYYDTPGVPVGIKSIVIQWDEPWVNFDDSVSDDRPEPLEGNGSMVILPYNVDITSKNAPEVSLVKYIGRKHPVSYYGTQMGESATWNAVIPKNDRATIYALRRLQVWAGDVYVREPSGTGYWASINVSFGEKHNELTIPVSFDIVRVEGGI